MEGKLFHPLAWTKTFILIIDAFLAITLAPVLISYFLKGKMKGDTVSILPNQESYKMNSFAIADCLIELEAEKELYKKGEMVSVNMII